jgi:hypothetical protein
LEDIYLDYLYDCYLANKRLTEEDWEYYGSEMHHVEIPSRDGGLLTPLNSQRLTTYQHWVAGVMQSEVLGKCCFAMMPVGVLPPYLDSLRYKWRSQFTKEGSHPSRGKVWVNNGVKETLVGRDEVIPEGWYKGRLPEVVEEMNKRSRVQLVGKTTEGTKWYFSGFESKRYTPGSQPEGWVEGRPEGKRGGRKKGKTG